MYISTTERRLPFINYSDDTKMKVIGGKRREEFNQVFQVPNLSQLSHCLHVQVSFQNTTIFNLGQLIFKDLPHVNKKIKTQHWSHSKISRCF